MPPRDVQAALRAIFAEWGLPGRLRVDNGAPWGSWNDAPPDLALWLIGLGVAVVWNRPRRCQENGHVERSHGVLQSWSEPATCADAPQLQRRLAELSALQREHLVGRRGQPRAAAHPGLLAGGRPYDPAREGRAWDERRVWRFLAEQRWRRRVDKVGRISLYNRSLGVGRAHAGADVVVRLDPQAVAWVIADERGRELKRRPPPELRRERILALAVTHRRPPRPRRPGGKPPAAPPGA